MLSIKLYRTDWHLDYIVDSENWISNIKRYVSSILFSLWDGRKILPSIYLQNKKDGGKWLWILKERRAQLGKYSWHASCPVYNLILTRRWPYKNLWTMDYLLHCCECESWNQTKNRRERQRWIYFTSFFVSGWLYYVCLYGKCFFFSCFPIFIEGIFYGTIVY